MTKVYTENLNHTMIQVTLDLFSSKNVLAFPDGYTIKQAIDQLQCTQFVVLYNGSYVPPEQYSRIRLHDGDEIKMLAALAGG